MLTLGVLIQRGTRIDDDCPLIRAPSDLYQLAGSRESRSGRAAFHNCAVTCRKQECKHSIYNISVISAKNRRHQKWPGEVLQELGSRIVNKIGLPSEINEKFKSLLSNRKDENFPFESWNDDASLKLAKRREINSCLLAKFCKWRTNHDERQFRHPRLRHCRR